MITVLSIPKPFNKKFNHIQQNAIRSWKFLTDDIILFGDDAGVKVTAKQLHVRHVPIIKKNSYETPILSDVFAKARKKAKYNIIVYANTDIILFNDFLQAVEKAVSLPKFLLIGKRRNILLEKKVSFSGNWQKKLKTTLHNQGRDNPVGNSSEFFCFPKAVKFNMPDFAIGRLHWDSWLIYRAKYLNIPVIDATPSVFYLHHIHDYSHHKNGFKGVWHGQEAQTNYQLAGGNKTRFKVTDSDYLMTKDGLKKPQLTIRSLVRLIRVKQVISSRLGIFLFPLYMTVLLLFKIVMLAKVLPRMNSKRILETLRNPGLLEYKLKEL